MNENSQKQSLGNVSIKGLFLGWIEEDLEEIGELSSESKLFQELREKHNQDWEIVETCREILFLNARCIQHLKARINDTKARIKELSRISG